MASPMWMQRRLGCGLSAPSSVTPTPLTSDTATCVLYWESVLDVNYIYIIWLFVNKVVLVCWVVC